MVDTEWDPTREKQFDNLILKQVPHRFYLATVSGFDSAIEEFRIMKLINLAPTYQD